MLRGGPTIKRRCVLLLVVRIPLTVSMAVGPRVTTQGG